MIWNSMGEFWLTVFISAGFGAALTVLIYAVWEIIKIKRSGGS
jgi:hypothetical protein